MSFSPNKTEVNKKTGTDVQQMFSNVDIWQIIFQQFVVRVLTYCLKISAVTRELLEQLNCMCRYTD